MVSKPPVHYINFPNFSDERGDLTFIEGNNHIPFEIKRVFYIYGVPRGAKRAGHAHKTCEQVLLAVSGSARVFWGDDEPYFVLSRPNHGIYIPPGIKISLENFSPDCVLLVLASEHFDEEDYVNETRPIRKSVT